MSKGILRDCPLVLFVGLAIAPGYECKLELKLRGTGQALALLDL